MSAAAIARRYARAVFTHGGSDWQAHLDRLAQIAETPDMRRLMDHPRVSDAQVLEIFREAAGSPPAEVDNLLRLLAQNRRLPLLPDIARLYRALQAQAQSRRTAHITSAEPLDEATQKRFESALVGRFGGQIELIGETEPALLGGARVQVDDWVYDGSVKADLARLKRALHT